MSPPLDRAAGELPTFRCPPSRAGCAANGRAAPAHLLGIDRKQLTYLHNGRSFRLTDVAGNVIRLILV